MWQTHRRNFRKPMQPPEKSLRYGTVPIVRETGGLKDTVEAYNEYEKTGTEDETARELVPAEDQRIGVSCGDLVVRVRVRDRRLAEN